MHIHGGITEYDADVLDFSANINFLGMPQAVREAAMLGVAESERYPDVHSRIFCEAAAAAHGVTLQMVLAGNGAAELIYALMRAMMPQNVLLMAPSFYEYEHAAALCKAQISYITLTQQEGFLPGERYIEALDHDPELAVLIQPNNPTGHILPMHVLEAVKRSLERGKTTFLVDECFLDFVTLGQQYSLIPYLKKYKKLIVLKSMTKLYAIPGLRIGYALSSNQKLLDQTREQMQPWNLSLPAQHAGRACFSQKEYVEESLNALEKEKRSLLAALARLPITVYGHDANFIFFRAQSDLSEKLLKRGIRIRDCSNFTGLSDGYFRICVRNSNDNRRLLQAMEEIR